MIEIIRNRLNEGCFLDIYNIINYYTIKKDLMHNIKRMTD